MFGEFGWSESYYSGTLGSFELGYLCASMRVYPALEGSVDFSAALCFGDFSINPALTGDLEVKPGG